MIDTRHLCEAVVCHENEFVVEIAKVLRDLKIRHLIVVDENDKPVGFVSQTDIIDKVVAEGKNSNEVKIKEIMTNDIVVLDSNEDYDKAYELMSKLRTFSIPVVTDEKIVGILDYTTLIEYAQKNNSFNEEEE